MLTTFLLDSWSFFKRHIITIATIVLPITIPFEIITTLQQNSINTEELVLADLLLPLLIDSMVYPVYTIAIIFYISSVVADKRIDIKTLWGHGIKFWLPFMIYSIASGIIITIGLILFIIPGLIYIARYAFAPFDLILNENTPFDAMKNSWHTAKDYLWIILGGYIVITVILFSPFYFASQLFTQGSAAMLIFEIISNIALSVLHVMYTVFSYRVYEYAINEK